MASVKIEIPTIQPDTCLKCPLIGMIPKNIRQKGKRQAYCCLGVLPHKPLTSKGIGVSANNKRKTGHLKHRVCDDKWEVWRRMYGDYFPLNEKSYQYRKDYEEKILEPMFDFR